MKPEQLKDNKNEERDVQGKIEGAGTIGEICDILADQSTLEADNGVFNVDEIQDLTQRIRDIEEFVKDHPNFPIEQYVASKIGAPKRYIEDKVTKLLNEAYRDEQQSEEESKQTAA